MAPVRLKTPWPDHTQLPADDGAPVRNSFEPWQSALLAETLDPVLRARFPEKDYFIGQDCGIYWARTEPPGSGCKAPDWYLVLGVPHLLDGAMRQSYVMWQELELPHLILEYASDGGDEERDDTPEEGKYWVYERKIRPAYYGIYLPEESRIEMYHLIEHHFEPMEPTARGRFPIYGLGVELGIWRGVHGTFDRPWMRWWGADGNLLPTGEEKAARLADKLRSLGIDPEAD